MSYNYPLQIAVAMPPVWMPLFYTVAWALVIGLSATLLAIPVARAFHRPAHGGWLIASMLLPPYMASVGLNAFRGPGTWIGDLIEKAVVNGWTGLPILVGKGIAGLGLALWVLPLAALILASHVRSLDPAVMEMFRMEPLSRWQRVKQWARLLRPGLVQAWLATTILMCGSAVPLHVAQVQTLAISVWKLMDQTALHERGVLWLATWPCAVISLVAAALIWRGLGARISRPEARGEALATSRGWQVTGIVVWLCAAVVPVGIALWSVDSAAALRAFWRVSGTAFRDSGVIGVCVGACVALLAALSAWRGPQIGIRVLVAAMVAIGVFPGMLVGALVATVSRGLGVDGIWGGGAMVVLAHVLRFGWIGCLAGVFLARAEPHAQRDHRQLDGAMSLAGWARSCLSWQWGGVLAAGLAGGAMSFCEIEATIFVQPPELESLPRQMLGHLHFSRTSELGAASFYVGAMMLLIAGVAGGLAARVLGQWSSQDSGDAKWARTKLTEAKSQP